LGEFRKSKFSIFTIVSRAIADSMVTVGNLTRSGNFNTFGREIYEYRFQIGLFPISNAYYMTRRNPQYHNIYLNTIKSQKRLTIIWFCRSQLRKNGKSK
jgi:hypothetical protein